MKDESVCFSASQNAARSNQDRVSCSQRKPGAKVTFEQFEHCERFKVRGMRGRLRLYPFDSGFVTLQLPFTVSRKLEKS